MFGPIVDDAGDLCSKADRRTFQQAAGKSDRPGIHPHLRRLL
jgi:hypothetical protein